MANVSIISSLILFLNTSIIAQVNIESGKSITEDFASIGKTSQTYPPPGWRIEGYNIERVPGPYPRLAAPIDKVGSVNITTVGIYNFGSTTSGNSTGGNDRCIGGLVAASESSNRSINIFIDIYNNGQTPIPSFWITYSIEKYRKGTKACTMQLYYSFDGISWTTAGPDFQTNFPADKDNLGYSQIAPGDTVIISKVLTLPTSIAYKSHLYLAWNNSVTSGSSSVNSQALGIDDVSITALSNNSSPLPVSLLQFSGERKDNRNMLSWSTATEINNKGFELQRSTDGNTYQPISFINSLASEGNSPVPVYYNYNDYTLTGEKQFYRLKLTDMDGKAGFSPTVLIQEEKKTEKLIIANIYPNPVRSGGSTTLVIDAPNRSKLSCTIEDQSGHIAKRMHLNVEQGSNIFRINVSDLRSGMYYLKCIGNSGNVVTQKMIIQ